MKNIYLSLLLLCAVSFSAQAQLCTTQPVPNTPVFGGLGEVTLSWSAPTDIVRCVIFFKVGSLTAPISITNPTGLLTSFNFDGYTPGETYYYRVRCSCDESDLRADLTPWSDIDSFNVPMLRNQAIDLTNKVWPNPATTTLYVGSQTGSLVEVFTASGIRVRSFEAKQEVAQLDIADLQNGLYIYRITTPEGTQISDSFQKF